MMADMFADNLVRNSIIQIIENKGRIKDNLGVWLSMTRRMFVNNPSEKVLNWVYCCMEEAADEQWFEKKWLVDKKFPKRNIDKKFKRKSVIKLNLKQASIRKSINDNLKIIDVAKSYGIKVRGKMAICPFHKDTNPSLSLSDDKNVFNCFGCGAKGNIIEFIRRCENEM